MRDLNGLGASSLPGEKILYFHVPKCGGTSIHQAFTAIYGGLAELLEAKASKRAAEALGDDPLHLRERWLAYHIAKARAPYIGGHFPWSPALAALGRNYRLATMLREPRAHFLSAFFFNRDGPDRDHTPIERNTALKDFVHSKRAENLGRLYVRYFTDPQLRTNATDSDAIETACRNLMTLDVVGTLEHLDEFVAQIDQLIGRHLEVGHERVSPTPIANQVAEMDDDLLAVIDELCRPNRVVYEAACQWRTNGNLESTLHGF
jgi:hypothetical protein